MKNCSGAEKKPLVRDGAITEIGKLPPKSKTIFSGILKIQGQGGVWKAWQVISSVGHGCGLVVVLFYHFFFSKLQQKLL